jgi:hypothetical protein
MKVLLVIRNHFIGDLWLGGVIVAHRIPQEIQLQSCEY